MFREELFSVVKNGDLISLRDLVNRGADSKSQNSDKETLLHVAAKYDHAAMIEPLLKCGIDIEAEDGVGMTSLHLASRYGYVDTMKELIKHKANILTSTYGGLSPLDVARNSKQSDAVKLLLESGVDLRVKDRDIPLSIACSTGNSDSETENGLKTHRILNKNIDTNATIDKSGQYRLSAYDARLYLACQKGYYETAELLLNHGANTEVKSLEAGKTPLYQAFTFRNYDIVGLLLSHNANPDLLGGLAYNRFISLLDEHKKNNKESIKKNYYVGISYGKTVRSWNNDYNISVTKLINGLIYKITLKNNTVAHLPLARSLLTKLRTQTSNEVNLLDKAAKEDIKAKRLWEVAEVDLTIVLSNQNIKSQFTLLTDNTTVKTLNLQGRQFLLGEAEALFKALENNTTLTMLNLSNCTIDSSVYPAFLEMINHNRTLTDIRHENCPLLNLEVARDSFRLACKSGEFLKAQQLFKYEAGVNKCDLDKKSHLHFACSEGNREIVEFLLNKNNKADVNAVDFLGRTPLHTASFLGNLDVVELLLAKGANVKARDVGGSTPLHLACKENKTLIVKLLLSKGADVSQLDTECFTNLLPILQTCEDKSQHLTVDLSNRLLTDDGLIHLAAALKLNPSITKLVLSGNKINHFGMCALAKALEVNESITLLDLSDNKIGSRQVRESGFQYLIAALYGNISLHYLNLKNCSLDAVDIKSLISFLKTRQHKTLQRIELDDKIIDSLSDEEKELFNCTATFFEIARQVEQYLPKYTESEWQVLEKKLGCVRELDINETKKLSVDEIKVFFSRKMTIYLEENKSQFLNSEENDLVKINLHYLDALAVSFDEYVGSFLSEEEVIVHYTSMVYSIRTLIRSARRVDVDEIITGCDNKLPSADVNEQNPIEVFHKSFENGMHGLYTAASAIGVKYVKCETASPIEKVAMAFKNILGIMPGLDKTAASASGILHLSGTLATIILTQLRNVSAVAGLARAITDTPPFEYGLNYYRDMIIRSIHELTEKDKLQNLVNCFSNKKGQLSKTTSIARAISHHYHNQIEKLTPSRAEAWGRYAYLHVADLFMSGVISGSLNRPLKATQLGEEAVLWLSYFPIRNNIVRIKMMRNKQKESLMKHFMQPRIKFKDNEDNMHVCTVMRKDENGLIITQNTHRPARWATQSEIDALNTLCNTAPNDSKNFHDESIVNYQLRFDQNMVLQLRSKKLLFATELSPYKSESKRNKEQFVEIKKNQEKTNNEVANLKKVIEEQGERHKEEIDELKKEQEEEIDELKKEQEEEIDGLKKVIKVIDEQNKEQKKVNEELIGALNLVGIFMKSASSKEDNRLYSQLSRCMLFSNPNAEESEQIEINQNSSSVKSNAM